MKMICFQKDAIATKKQSTMTVELFDIDKDGLPDMDKLTGRVAFIFDGAILSGWPLYNVHLRHPGNNFPEYTKYDWECSEAAPKVFSGVKKYIIFDKPLWEY